MLPLANGHQAQRNCHWHLPGQRPEYLTRCLVISVLPPSLVPQFVLRFLRYHFHPPGRSSYPPDCQIHPLYRIPSPLQRLMNYFERTGRFLLHCPPFLWSFVSYSRYSHRFLHKAQDLLHLITLWNTGYHPLVRSHAVRSSCLLQGLRLYFPGSYQCYSTSWMQNILPDILPLPLPLRILPENCWLLHRR